MQQDAGRNVSVIPIIGIGGLGKTTIAKLVYSDERAVSHFQLRMWVCVSEDFDVTRLIKEILKSAIGKTNENLDVDGLQNSLRELFKDKKLLENLGVDELQSNLRELLKSNSWWLNSIRTYLGLLLKLMLKQVVSTVSSLFQNQMPDE